jgi:6-phosphogluconolactonase (cycloisomerase 2 family)
MPTSARINLGQTLQFTAIGTFTDGSTQDLTTLVRWSSQSQFPVATISSQGLATGVGEGIATIIAAGQGQQCQHHCTATATLTVIRPRLVSITLTPANPSVQVGNRLQLTAIGNFNDGSTTDLTTQTIWSSSNPNVATISNTLGSQGHVTGVAEGTTTITANSGPPLISSVILVVSSQPPGSIAVRPAFVSIPLGDAQQFTAAITLADGTAQDVTTAVNWSTSNPAVASISNALGSQGRATSLTLGTTTITATQGSASGSTTLTVVALVPGQARFAYVTNSVDFTVSLYRVDGSTGLLTPNGTTFVGDQTFPDAVAADPMGRFLYVANRQANTVSAYTIDSRAGLLTAIAGPPVFASVPFGLAAHPSGEFLFVANGPGSVSTYSIGSTGVLTFISQTAVAAGGAISVAVDPSGSFVYAANVNANTLSAYSFDSTTGILSPVPGSPFPTGPTPQSVTVDPSGKFVYAPNGNGQSVSAYTIDSTTGALTPVASSPFAVGMIPNSVAVDPTGKFAYVTNRASDTISAFTVDSTTGALQPTAGSPFSVPVNFTPVQVTVDPLGKTLYVINQLGNGISLFVIDSVSGALTSLGLVPAGLVPLSMVLTR